MAVPSSLAAYQTYRRQVRQRLSAELALKFLLQSYDFPRAVHFCRVRTQRVLAAMPPRPRVERQANRLIGLARNADPAVLAASSAARFMDDIQLELGALDATIARGYFDA